MNELLGRFLTNSRRFLICQDVTCYLVILEISFVLKHTMHGMFQATVEKNSNKMEFVLVIAWVAVKFGINTTLVVLEIYHFQYNKSGKFPIQQEWYLSQISLLPMLFPHTHCTYACCALALPCTQFVTMY